MTFALLLLVISTSGQLVMTAHLGFFGNIHSDGYPSFDWLGSDFADFGPQETASLPSVKQGDKETEIGKVSKSDKVVKRHHSDTMKNTENKIFNPSKYYYPKTNIKPEENNILEPVIKKIYEERKEDIYIPVYQNNEKTSLYEIHGIPEETSSFSQPQRGPEHEDGQQFILDKYVDDRVRNFYQTNNQDKTKTAENHFYSLKDFENQDKFIFTNPKVTKNNREESYYDSYYEKPRENTNQNSPTEHKQVKKSAQFFRPATEGGFDSFFDEIKQNPEANFPSFDFASSFPQFNDAGKFFENDENEQIFQVHNVHRSKPKAFVQF